MSRADTPTVSMVAAAVKRFRGKVASDWPRPVACVIFPGPVHAAAYGTVIESPASVG
jgi:hypothetical protein